MSPAGAAGMNIKSNRHCRVRYLGIRHHVRQPEMIARSLHLHSVAVVPIQLDVLNFNVADAVDVDQACPLRIIGASHREPTTGFPPTSNTKALAVVAGRRTSHGRAPSAPTFVCEFPQIVPNCTNFSCEIACVALKVVCHTFPEEFVHCEADGRKVTGESWRTSVSIRVKLDQIVRPSRSKAESATRSTPHLA